MVGSFHTCSGRRGLPLLRQLIDFPYEYFIMGISVYFVYVRTTFELEYGSTFLALNRKLTIIVKYLLDFETFRTLTGFENANVVFSLSFLKILELSKNALIFYGKPF